VAALTVPALPSLILLPGMDGTGDLFAPILPYLKSSFPVVVVDYPIDQSLDYATLTNKVLKRCPEGRYVLVAESFSGPIAAEIAGRAPDRLLAVIFVCSFLRTPSRIGALFRNVLQIVPKPRPPSWMTATAVRQRLLNGCPDERVVQSVVAAVERVEVRVLAERLRGLLGLHALPATPARALPVAYLRATADRLVGDDAWADIRAVYPDAQRFDLAGPHCLLQSHPSEAAAVITRFVANALDLNMTADA